MNTISVLLRIDQLLAPMLPFADFAAIAQRKEDAGGRHVKSDSENFPELQICHERNRKF